MRIHNMTGRLNPYGEMYSYTNGGDHSMYQERRNDISIYSENEETSSETSGYYSLTSPASFRYEDDAKDFYTNGYSSTKEAPRHRDSLYSNMKALSIAKAFRDGRWNDTKETSDPPAVNFEKYRDKNGSRTLDMLRENADYKSELSEVSGSLRSLLASRKNVARANSLEIVERSKSPILPSPPGDDLDNEYGGMVVTDFTVPNREYPVTHPAVDAPLCRSCRQMDLAFFDPNCIHCQNILRSPHTSIAQIFAILRQWVPQTQQNIHLLIHEILRRGAHINDRDSLTDMTLLQYACKAGANGVGNASEATKVVRDLLNRGADPHMRCRWTNMAAVHYASYFDVSSVLKLLLSSCSDISVDSACQEYDNGTPLHIAASNLCLDAAKVLIQHGADLKSQDNRGRIPSECVPDSSTFDLVPDVQALISKMLKLLTPSATGSVRGSTLSKSNPGVASGRAVLQAMSLRIGDRVVVSGTKTGTLRYCGTTEFATGIWAGIELDTAEGKNDGSVKGVLYFKCSANHGLFAPINRIAKLSASSNLTRTASIRRSQRSMQPKVNHAKVDLSRVSSKVNTGVAGGKELYSVGERVVVIGAGRRKGTVKFAGETSFASGMWYGVELDTTDGKNDGSVHGVRYFSCKINHGVFAPPGRVMRLSPSCEMDNELDTSFESDSLRSSKTHSRSSDISAYTTLNRSLSLRNKNKQQPSSSTCTFTRSLSVRYGSLNRKETKEPSFVQPIWQSVSAEPEIPRRKKDQRHWLECGTNVLFHHDVGIIKYIGPVEFAEGVWLGLELRTPIGRHDGIVNGKRYFTCKINHGIMTKPNKVTIRGINGALLVKPVEAYTQPQT